MPYRNLLGLSFLTWNLLIATKKLRKRNSVETIVFTTALFYMMPNDKQSVCMVSLFKRHEQLKDSKWWPPGHSSKVVFGGKSFQHQKAQENRLSHVSFQCPRLILKDPTSYKQGQQGGCS